MSSSSSSSSSSSISFLTSRPASILLLLSGSSLLYFLSPKWIQYFKAIPPSSNDSTSSTSLSKHLPSLPNSSNHQRKPIAIFWDVDNCSPPSGSSGREIALAIRKAVQLATTPSRNAKSNNHSGNDNPIVVFKAYLELSAENSAPLSREQVLLRSELQGCGVTLIDTPKSGRKNVADFMMITDLLAHAIDNEPPYRIVVITGDRDFAYPVGVLRNRSYEIVLITPPVGAPPILEASANLVLSWRKDVLGISKDSSGRSYEDKKSITTPPTKNINLSSSTRENSSTPMKKTTVQNQTPQKPQVSASQFPQYQSSPSNFVSYQQQMQQSHNHQTADNTQTLSPQLFKPLTDLLRSMAREGDSFPLRGMVAVRLSPIVYQEVGARRWAEYAQLAELAGVIKLGIGSSTGTEWVALPEEVEKKNLKERSHRLEHSRKAEEENRKRVEEKSRELAALNQNQRGDVNNLIPRAVQVSTSKAVTQSISEQKEETKPTDNTESSTSTSQPQGKDTGLTNWLFGSGTSEDESKKQNSNENGDVLGSNPSSTDSQQETSIVKPFIADEPWPGKLMMPLDSFHPLLEIMKQLANDYQEPSTSTSNSNSSSISGDSIARASKVSKSLSYLKDQNVFDPFKSCGVKDFKEYMTLAETQGIARLRLKIKEKKLSKILGSEDGKSKEKEDDQAFKGREIVVLREKYKRAYTGSLPSKSADTIKDTSTVVDADIKPKKRSSSPIKKAFKKTLFGESEKKTSDESSDPVVAHTPSNLPIRKSLLTLVNLLNNQRKLGNFYVTSTFIHKSFLKLPSNMIKSLKVKNKDEFEIYLKGAEEDGVIEISDGFKKDEKHIRLKREFFSDENKATKSRIGDGYKAQKEFKGNEEFFKDNGEKVDQGGDWIDEENEPLHVEDDEKVKGAANESATPLPAFGGIASGAIDWFK